MGLCDACRRFGDRRCGCRRGDLIGSFANAGKQETTSASSSFNFRVAELAKSFVFSVDSESLEWVKQWQEGILPPPPRCSDRVSSLYLPACGFPAPGDPRFIASRVNLPPRRVGTIG